MFCSIAWVVTLSQVSIYCLYTTPMCSPILTCSRGRLKQLLWSLYSSRGRLKQYWAPGRWRPTISDRWRSTLPTRNYGYDSRALEPRIGVFKVQCDLSQQTTTSTNAIYSMANIMYAYADGLALTVGPPPTNQRLRLLLPPYCSHRTAKAKV